VVLSTIHSAKGLEWDVVFMVGVEEGVLPHANNDDVEEERRVAYVGVTRAKRLLGLTYADVRYGQDSMPSQFLHELAGKQRRLCVWTGPRSDGTDDRLPLLSVRERQRLVDGLLPEPERFPQRREPLRREPLRREKRGKRKVDSTARASKREVKERERLIKNKIDGAPARHGVAWSGDEDDRLRAMFLSGKTIAAMAGAHQRKNGAITARLIKLGLISEPAIP
jgi:ATP-dependent exoDNAse (exonuclease V) beta subunit